LPRDKIHGGYIRKGEAGANSIIDIIITQDFKVIGGYT